MHSRFEDVLTEHLRSSGEDAPSEPSPPAKPFVESLSEKIRGPVGLKIDDELMEVMKKLGVVDESGTDYGPNYSSDGIPANRQPKDGKTYDVEGLSLLLRYYLEGIQPSEVVGGRSGTHARTRLSPDQLIANQLIANARMPSSAHRFFEDVIEQMDDDDKNLWIKCLQYNCVYTEGQCPFVLLITMQKEDPKDADVFECFYGPGPGHYGTGSAAGQINRIPVAAGGNHSQFNKHPVALDRRWNAHGSILISRPDGNRHRYGLWQADRIRVQPDRVASALARGYHIVGFGVGDWMNHIYNQAVNLNAYRPVYGAWAPGGFIYAGYTGTRPLSPADLARNTPTKSEMNIGGMEECSAGTHQAMLLGYAHTKQQVDCVEVRHVAYTAAGSRVAAPQIDAHPAPIYSNVFEGIRTSIMSWRAESTYLANNHHVSY